MTKPARTRETGPVPLLVAILRGRPSLPEAACTGHHVTFDLALHPEPGTDPVPARVAAERLCRGCIRTTSCPESLEARPHQEKTA